MPTTITSTIGSAGGRDYSDPATWEAAAPANLVTADQIWRGECYNDSTFTGAFMIAGSTVDSTRYKELTAAAGQSFADTSSNALRFNSANGATILGSGGYSTQITCSENYFRLSRLQVGNSANNSSAFTSGSTGLDINQCVFQSGTNVGAASATVALSTSSKIRNSLIRTTNTSWPALELANDASAYNVTLVSLNSSTVRGVSGFYCNGVVQNCAQFGFALASKTANSSSMTITTSYTDVVGPTGGWTGSIAFNTATFGNITAGSEDLKLVSGSALLDVGTTDSTNAANDIFGTARPTGSAYDIGCHEFSSGAPVITVQPEKQRVGIGDAASFSVTATGATSYQWQNSSSGSFANISGETASSYTTGALAAGLAYTVRVVVTNGSGSTDSAAVDLWTPAIEPPAWEGLYGRGGMRAMSRMAGLLPTSGQNELIGSDALFGTVANSGAYTLSADPVNYAVTAAPAGTLAARPFAANSVAYTLTHAPVTLTPGRAVVADPTAYTLTLAPATLEADRALPLDPATYTLTHAPVTLTPGRSLAVDPTAYTVTMLANTLPLTRYLPLDPTAYTVTAVDATLVPPVGASVLSADPVSYAVTAADAGVLAGRRVSADASVYSITFAPAGVLAGRALDAGVVAFTVTPADAAPVVRRALDVSAVVYNVSLPDTRLLYSGAVANPAGGWLPLGRRRGRR